MKIIETCDLESNKVKHWQEHLVCWRRSGLNQSQYCRQQGLRWHTFHYWRKKLEITSPAKVGGSRLRLVPLTALERPDAANSRNPDPAPRLRVHIGHLTLDAEETINAEVLKRLVCALAEVAPCGK